MRQALFKRNLLKCGKTVTIEDRSEQIVNNTSTEIFTNPVTVPAIVKTLRGVKTFDDTNTERVASHEICIEASRKVAITSITESGLVATVTTSAAHSLKTGFRGTVSGANEPEYNLGNVVITVTGPTTFTYMLLATPGGPATGTPIFTYVQNYTSENWVKLGSERIKILFVENCCEKDVVLKLTCSNRGEDSQIVNTT